MDNLYRINRRWVFDLETFIGYYVVNIDKFGIAKMEQAFKISDEGNNVEYYKKVPVGVVRKAMHLVDLKRLGKLEEIEREIKHGTSKNGGVRK